MKLNWKFGTHVLEGTHDKSKQAWRVHAVGSGQFHAVRITPGTVGPVPKETSLQVCSLLSSAITICENNAELTMRLARKNNPDYVDAPEYVLTADLRGSKVLTVTTLDQRLTRMEEMHEALAKTAKKCDYALGDSIEELERKLKIVGRRRLELETRIAKLERWLGSRKGVVEEDLARNLAGRIRALESRLDA